MSGIAGMVNPFEDISMNSVNISAVSELIRNRGSHGAGHFFCSNAVLLRRVNKSCQDKSIAELELEGKTYVLVLDGAIYNAKELKSQLNILGNSVNTSDSELLIYAYIKWKEGMLNKINGIFAFALWIKEDKKLILARDHVGAKPLFFAFSGEILLFCSRIQGITNNPLFKTTMDIEGLSELICLSPRFSPSNAIFKGVHRLMPGYYFTYSPEGSKKVRYWIMDKNGHDDDIDKTLSTVRDLITDSVLKQMDPDIPQCGFLSGGLYSSLITAIAVKKMKKYSSDTYNTWSVDFETGNRYIRQWPIEDSDAPWIRWVCRKSGTRHHYIILSSKDLADSLLEATEARGFPGMADFDSSLLLLSREIQKDFNIVFAGDCSDEIFGCGLKASDCFSQNKRRLPWSSNLAEKISVFKNEITSLISPYEYIEKCYEEALTEYLKFSINAERLTREYEAQWFSLYWNLPCILERLDTMSMACGLEARVPFCDVRLIEYFWNIPYELKRYNNRDRGLLREA
ncbi:MAG: asparagine synthase (glutamine-hydrolyzing), partial [Clostridiaceae bacterium]|nr:asparagine synthase (glutamine-hydrolyzing) [Clostridiaceae bacterium]